MLDILEKKYKSQLEFLKATISKITLLEREIEFPIYLEVLSDCSNRLGEYFYIANSNWEKQRCVFVSNPV